MWGTKIAVRTNVTVNAKSPCSTKVAVPAECRRAKLVLPQKDVQRHIIKKNVHLYTVNFLEQYGKADGSFFSNCHKRVDILSKNEHLFLQR